MASPNLARDTQHAPSRTSAAFRTATDTLMYAVPHLAGAIDILAVLQPDGSLKVSPFYVRFGKYSSLRSADKDKRVHISVNGVEQSYHMQLGRTGEAYFIEEIDEPFPSSEGGYVDGRVLGDLMSPPAGESDDDTAPLTREATDDPLSKREEVHPHAGLLAMHSAPLKVERSSALPGDAIRRIASESSLTALRVSRTSVTDIDVQESCTGSGPNPIVESEAVPGVVVADELLHRSIIELSLCGDDIMTCPEHERWSRFKAHKVSTNAFQNNADCILADTRLWCRFPDGKMLPFREAEGLIISCLAYGSNLDCKSVFQRDKGEQVPHRLKRADNKRAPPHEQVLSATEEDHLDNGSISGDSDQSGGSSPRGWRGWLSLSWGATSGGPSIQDDAIPRRGSGESSPSDVVPVEQEAALLAGAVGGQASHVEVTEVGGIRRSPSGSRQTVILRKRSFVPAAEHLPELAGALKPGINEVDFRFGKSSLRAYVYLVRWDQRLVISDIDGTITKSDVLGHLGQLLGYDWTHSGVTGLFAAIARNGYWLLFLSSRSIAQASTTRDYLWSLRQDGLEMPRGPVIISPDGLFPSLYREVVLRRPHEFKIRCLEDIKSLFPEGWNPFVAGFGNRDTDQTSYRAVGVPASRIFIINPKGELRLASSVVVTSSLRSLPAMTALVDALFPSITHPWNGQGGHSPIGVAAVPSTEEAVPSYVPVRDEYYDHNFWKLSLPYVIDEEEDLYEDAVGSEPAGDCSTMGCGGGLSDGGNLGTGPK